MKSNQWARLLAYVTGLVNQELLLQKEYLAAENRVLCGHACACRIRASDSGAKACVAKPDTILAWYQRLIARKFDGSQCRIHPSRPRISAEVEELVIRFARENPRECRGAFDARSD